MNHRHIAAAWLAILGIVPAGLLAQSTDIVSPPTLDDEAIAALPLDQRFSTLWGQGRYLRAIDEMESSDQTQISEGALSYYRQMRPALDGFFLTDPAASALPAADSAELAAFDGARVQEAVAAIVEQAQNRRIIIVNEAHNSPRDRAFILALAEALKPLGFTHYAAETLANWSEEFSTSEMARLEAQRYPVRGTGTYSADPMFGYLIRRVMELGYRPVAYESRWMPDHAEMAPEDRIPAREQAQAENLARALEAAGPDAKFLIHVGYAHAAERPLPPGETDWMAARLAKLTGLDPLTIDQTDISEVAFSPQSRALHRDLASRLGGRSGIFFKNGEPVRSGRLGNAVDLQVVHPLVTVLNARPHWLAQTGRIAVSIPQELLPREGRKLVQAFVEGEAADAIPLDQALAVAGREPPVLYVPDGIPLRWAVQE